MESDLRLWEMKREIQNELPEKKPIPSLIPPVTTDGDGDGDPNGSDSERDPSEDSDFSHPDSDSDSGIEVPSEEEWKNKREILEKELEIAPDSEKDSGLVRRRDGEMEMPADSGSSDGIVGSYEYKRSEAEIKIHDSHSHSDSSGREDGYQDSDDSDWEEDSHRYMIRRREPELKDHEDSVSDSDSEDDADRFVVRRRLPKVEDSSSEDDAHRYMIRRRLPEEVDDSSSEDDAHRYMIRRRLPEEVEDSCSEDDAHRYMIRRRLPEEVEDHVEMAAAQDFEQNDGDSEEIDIPSSPLRRRFRRHRGIVSRWRRNSLLVLSLSLRRRLQFLFARRNRNISSMHLQDSHFESMFC